MIRLHVGQYSGSGALTWGLLAINYAAESRAAMLPTTRCARGPAPGRRRSNNEWVAVCVELRDEAGCTVLGLPDPSGGTFDAAGDFDRFVDQPPYRQVADGIPILESVDPLRETIMPFGVMAGLIADCARATAVAHDGPERRGLLRLRVLAEGCSRRPGFTLVWTGD